ncbi:MAG: transcription elongation factor Spt5, partial [Candidatus Thorarchaeota archaeon]
MTKFFAVRVLKRYEMKVAQELADFAKLEGITTIKSIFVPPTLQGCVIVECEKKIDLINLLRQMKQTRGLFRGKLNIEDVYKLLTVPEELLKPGTKVEVTAGPFRGSRAKVIRDDGKEVTIMLLDWEFNNRIKLSRSQLKKV